MKKIKIEAFLSIPTCSGGISLSRLLKKIQDEQRKARIDQLPGGNPRKSHNAPYFTPRAKPTLP